MAEEIAPSRDSRPQAIAPQAIALVPIDPGDLRRLAASERVDLGTATAPEGALPPAHVAVHALAQLEASTPADWCVAFLIVAKMRDAILGGCRFKSAPIKRPRRDR